jgi:hypothetical protein
VDLALGGHRVDDAAAVVDHHVVQKLHAAGQRIDLDLDRVHADAVGQRRGLEVDRGVEPGPDA